MRAKLEKILQEKSKTRKSLNELRNNYLVTIYKGACDGLNYREIHKKLLKDTINSKVIDEIMYKNACKIAKKVINTMPKPKKQDNTEFLSISAYNLIHNMHADKVLSQNIYKKVNDIAEEKKKMLIGDTINENRHKVEPVIFYLASEHDDCALDHKDYQGKMYFDGAWGYLYHDRERIKEIKKYIDTHKLKTIQWVTHKPVWFITRPNCRHYFKALNTDEVLHSSVKELVERHDLHTKIGNREYMQTLRHRTDAKWYADRNNAETILRKYEERYELHKALYNANGNTILKRAMEKDSMLIRKWRDYLSNM